MGRFITRYSGISYTHRLLWQIAAEQADLARQRERGRVNCSLVAVTFAFHALEAYVNFAGTHLAPDIWKNERKYFRSRGGWQGKLRTVLDLTGVPWDPDIRPLKTILELQVLRDSIAHGKAERFADTFEHDDDLDELMHMFPDAKIRSMVLPKSRLDEVLADVRGLLERIHPVVAKKVNEPFFKASALDGTTWWVTRSTELKK